MRNTLFISPLDMNTSPLEPLLVLITTNGCNKKLVQPMKNNKFNFDLVIVKFILQFFYTDTHKINTVNKKPLSLSQV